MRNCSTKPLSPSLRPQQREVFTLIELLVVVFIVALLAALPLQALNNSNNERHLGTSHYLHAADTCA